MSDAPGNALRADANVGVMAVEVGHGFDIIEGSAPAAERAAACPRLVKLALDAMEACR